MNDYPTRQCVVCKSETRIKVESESKTVYVCHNHVDEGRKIVRKVVEVESVP